MSQAILCIGGMDSSGGAGILRDAATITAMGGMIRAAVTAVTAQTDRAVTSVHPVPALNVVVQIACSGPVGAIKIGMLGTAEIVRAIPDVLPNVPCVLDPVLLSSSGHPLLEDSGFEALLSDLLPHVDLVTPNLPELTAMAARLGYMGNDAAQAAEALLGAGAPAVLVKGGHGTGEHSVDILFRKSHEPRVFAAPRVAASLRGSGCRLASAIACGLAGGEGLVPAIKVAKSHVHAALMAATD